MGRDIGQKTAAQAQREQTRKALTAIKALEQQLVKLVQRAAADPRDWSIPGTTGYVAAKLEQLVADLKG